MDKIITSNFPDLGTGIKDKAIEQFYELRKKMHNDPNTEKKVSTSELIDWVRILNAMDEKEILSNLDEAGIAFNQALLKSKIDFTLHSGMKEEEDEIIDG